MEDVLSQKKDEFVRVSLEIVDLKKQIKNLQGELKSKEEDAARIMSDMCDVCGKTGLSIYEGSFEG